MANTFKQFGAWGTAWKSSDPFRRARVALTLWYVGIIVVVAALFSVSFYVAASQQIQESFHEYTGGSSQGQEENVLEDAQERLAWLLVAIDGAVLLVSAFASYGFAGYTLKPIRQALEGQKRFVADASHELRTPLAVMRTSVEVLLRQRTDLPNDVKSTMSSLLEEISILTRLSSQLLELSKAEGKGFASDFSSVDLQHLVQKVAARFQSLAHASGVTLAIGKLQAAQVFGNQHFLEHALANVIENAVKYNRANGKVEVSLVSSGDRVEITVADTGIGIAEKDLPFIFERFYKGGHSEHGKGTGLGLSIVKAIVDAHGGSLAVCSTLGEGTTVSLILPPSGILPPAGISPAAH
jgi:signal transduction histidine kinase